MWIAFLVFGATLFVLVSGGLLFLYRAESSRWLARTGSAQQDVALLTSMASEPVSTKLEKLVQPFHKIIPRNDAEASSVGRQLAMAGYRGAKYVNIFYAAKVLAPLLFCGAVTVTRAFEYSPLFVYVTAACIGYLVPGMWLSWRISARQTEIRFGLPEALDLLVICLEAGLSLDRATLRTADELRLSQPALADEMGLVNLEQRSGVPRGDAWRHCGDRTGVDTVRALAAVMIQADKFGTSVGKALRIHSETLRTRRRQEAEERAAKTTVKLVFPLVLFIFPSLFVVTIGPSMIIMFDSFDKYLN
ncbi:MAG: type II secretion system F family protein [Bryobacteraceae bacterium]